MCKLVILQNSHCIGFNFNDTTLFNAIEQNKRVWTNVSIFQEFTTPAAFDYAVTSLPANFLIDENDKVIAKNLHLTELKLMLEKLFSK